MGLKTAGRCKTVLEESHDRAEVLCSSVIQHPVTNMVQGLQFARKHPKCHGDALTDEVTGHM